MPSTEPLSDDAMFTLQTYLQDDRKRHEIVQRRQKLRADELRCHGAVVRTHDARRGVQIEIQHDVAAAEAHEGIVNFSMCTQAATVLLHPDLTAKRVIIRRQLQPGRIEDQHVRVDPDDAVFDVLGVKVIVDNDSLKIIDGTQVDFVKEGINEAFKFRNPNVKGECGCGESFSI